MGITHFDPMVSVPIIFTMPGVSGPFRDGHNLRSLGSLQEPQGKVSRHLGLEDGKVNSSVDIDG